MKLRPSPIVTIVKRELLTGLRSWKSLFLLLFLLTVLFVYLYNIFDYVDILGFNVARTMQQLFFLQVYVMLFTAMTLVPASAAVSLGRERADGSFDLLMTTMIPPSRIVFGKLSATLIIFLLMGVGLLPFTGLIFFFAGVDLYRFFQAAAVILPVALSGAALGMWVSTRIDNPARAIVLSFCLVMMVNLGLPVFLAWLEWDPGLLGTLTPFGLLGDRIARGTGWEDYGVFAAYQGVFALVALLAACYNLRRAETLSPMVQVIQRRLPWKRVPQFRPMSDRANPIAVRESYGGFLSRRQSRIIVSSLVFLVYLYILFKGYAISNEPLALLATLWIERLLLLVLIPPVVAVCFVRDREETTWDLLRLTLSTPFNVVMGKFQGIGQVLLPFFAPVYATNVVVLLFLALKHGHRDDYIWTMGFFGELIFLPLHALVIAAAAFIGICFTRKVTTAVAAGYITLIISTFLFLIVQFQLVATGSGLGSVIGVGVGHGMLCIFALFIGFGVVMARVSQLWESNTTDASPFPAPPAATPPSET